MPDFRDYVRKNLPPLGLSGAREAEIVEELALDFQESYERALRGGLNPEEAWEEAKTRALSWKELGERLRLALGEPRVELSSRRTNLFARYSEDLVRDFRYAVRQLAKSPGFTFVAVVMLALGIGANTAIFSLLNAILLRQLPVSHTGELVLFGEARPQGDTSFLPHGNTQIFSYPFFREFRRENQAFADVAAIQSFLALTYARIAGGAALEKIKVELVSGSYFQTLGVNPVAGRVFTSADDETPGAHPIAVASYSWWRNHFGGGPAIEGKTIAIGSTVYTIIGVAPPEFFGITVGQSPDVWIPLAMQREICPDRNGLDNNLFQSLHMIARLKPGVSRGQAQANTNLLFRRILRSYVGPKPSQDDLDDIRHAWIELKPAATGRSRLRAQFTEPLVVLMAVVALVLLIACANVANLLLVRAAARQREIAVRMALGANRARLVRQLISESAVLGFAGAVLGAAIAWAASRLLVAMVSPGSEMLPIHVTPDLRVLGFTVAVAMLTVFVFGAAPALRATRVELAGTLKSSRGVISPGTRNRLARGLVAGQVALSTVLLAGAGLFLRSLANLMDVDVGFDRQNVVRVHIDPGAAGYRDERLVSVMTRIEERASSLTGVRAASFALSVFDGGGSATTDIRVPGLPPKEHRPAADINTVGPQYLDVVKIPLLFGRGLSARDTAASRKVAVINQTMARIYFPGGSPLGRTFSVGEEPGWQDIEVVGVMKDAKYMLLEEKQMPAAFFPYSQHLEHFNDSFVVRYAGDPASIVPEIRRCVAEIDPNLPVSDVRTLAQMVDDFTLNRRLVAELSTFFGILAALLASIGIYGVMSYGIARRTNEFGIRMALGAKRTDVLRAVLGEALVMSAAGAAIGLALALAASRLVESVLYGVKSTNLLVMALAMAAMIVAGLAAGYVPARRATRIDPSVALRYD
ncbi:MAG TPA: ABC transporter permease [Bryobacteraceae bacterium]|nr:ABC transporter permease [Bryobacteraceae bacterium]